MEKRIYLKSVLRRILPLICGMFVLPILFTNCNPEKQNTFKHHVIADPIPGKQWTGGFTLADYDKDGDLDVTAQSRSDEIIQWFEFQDLDKWIPHFVGTVGDIQLGSNALDVDRDGYIDLIVGQFWFRNPGNLVTNPDSEWEKHKYNGSLQEENHDIGIADFNLDGIDDIVMYNQAQSTLRWYNPADPFNWTFTDIATDVDEDYVHSGIFPQGVSDLDDDGFPDVILPIYWYKNPGNTGEGWIKIKWPYIVIDPTPYGKGIRVWTGDINNSGLNDIIYSDCDGKHSRLYILFNKNGGKTWEMEEIPIPASNVGESGSFHSLQIADFNNDGLSDIFIGEQEHVSDMMKPEGLKERGIVFQNTGTAEKPIFSPVIINLDNPGWHDALVGDVEGDGDIDIVSKIWSADGDGEGYHIDFWENELK